MKKLIAILFLSIAITGCSQADEVRGDKPDAVPEAAIWVGGSDGGVYVNITWVNDEYSGGVYFEHNGEIWYEGPFEYSGEKAFDVSDKASYSAWDGEKLYLTNGEWLQSN